MKQSFIDADVGDQEDINKNILPPNRQHNSIQLKKSISKFDDIIKVSSYIKIPQIQEIRDQILVQSLSQKQFVQEQNCILGNTDFQYIQQELNIKSDIKIVELKDTSQFVQNQRLFYEMIKEFKITQYNKLNKLNQAYYILIQKPQLICRIFEISSMNMAGAYGVWTNQNGIWQLQKMDQKYPVYDDNQYILDEQAQFWRILLDKALAQTFGGYNNLLNADISLIISAVSGCPYFQHKVKKNIYQMVKKWLKNGYLVYFHKIKQDGQDDEEYYNVSKFYEKFNTNSKYLICQTMNQNQRDFQVLDAKLIQEKEPNLTTSQVFQNKNSVVVDNEQILQQFDVVNVVKLHENYFYESTKLSTSTQKYFLINLSVQADNHVYLKFSQQQKNQIRLICFKLSDGDSETKLIKGEYSQDQNIFMNHHFQQGNYIILFEVCNQGKITEDIILSTYAQKNSLQIQVIESDQDCFFQYQQIAIQQLVQIPTQTQTITDYSEQNLPEIKVTTDNVYGILYYFYDNQSDFNLQENLDFSEFQLFRYSQIKTGKDLQIDIAAKTQKSIIFYQDIEKIDKYEYLYPIQEEDDINDDEDEEEKNKNKLNIKITSLTDDVNKGGSQIRSKRVTSINNENIEQYLQTLNQNDDKQEDKLDVINEEPQKKTIDDFNQQIINFGKKQQIIQNDIQINVDFYVLQHHQGVVFYYQNNFYQSYNQTLKFSDLNNLTIQNQNIDGNLKFTLNKNEQIYIFLDVIDKDKNYSYKTESKFDIKDN